jgi:hypothetical protein
VKPPANDSRFQINAPQVDRLPKFHRLTFTMCLLMAAAIAVGRRAIQTPLRILCMGNHE